MKNQHGFTLIELLVVIAIIGILSAVVLASLNTARSKGNDAAIKTNLDSIGSQAMLYLLNNSSGYGAFDNGSGGPATCPTSGAGTVFRDATIEKAVAAALADSGGGIAACFSTATAYAVAVSRPTSVAAQTSTYWCVDSTGVHCGINSVLLTGAACGTCASTQ